MRFVARCTAAVAVAIVPLFLQLLQLRFVNGVASSLDVLDAQRELFSAEQTLVQARLLRTTTAIDLYRTLGGGLR